MREGYFYTIGFTFVISVILTTILAVTNAAYMPRINQNEEIAFKGAILYVLDMHPTTKSEVVSMFAESIQQFQLAGIDVYARRDENLVIHSYALPLQGSGLWGMMEGYVGVSADLQTLLGIEFTKHNETPGLGGRIDERIYKEQFRGVPLGNLPIVHTEDLNAITGATSTSNAVLRIVNDTMNKVLPKLEVHHERRD